MTKLRRGCSRAITRCTIYSFGECTTKARRGLWPVVLWAAVKLHLPFAAINWIGGAFASVGVLLLLLRSPFPPIIRWLLPFTFFFAYQYAVIARPYTLFAALIFLLCILFAQDPPKPILFALVAGLLVNIGLHAAILAGVFSLLYLHQVRARRREAASSLWSPDMLLACATFIACALISVAVAFPSADAVIAGRPTKELASPTSLLARLVTAERLPNGAPPLDEALDLASVKARAVAVRNGGIVPAPLPWLILAPFKAAVFGLDGATFPIARSNLLSSLFLLILFLWLRKRHTLRFALPWLLGLLLSSQVLILDHHTGQFAIVLIAAVWLSIECAPVKSHNTGFHSLDAALFGTALLVILLQIGWTLRTIGYERKHPYDPGLATANFLRTHDAGKRIAGFSYESVTTEANSTTRLFSNQPAAYWIWSGNTYPDLRRTEARLEQPDVVVQGELIEGSEVPFNQWGGLWEIGQRPYEFILEDWKNHGYHATHRFCGERLMRMGTSSTFCEVILEPDRNKPTEMRSHLP